MIKKLFLTFTALCTFSALIAQQDSTVDQIYSILILDSITIKADQSRPNIKSMIRHTINDTTFYLAFQRLRRKSYKFLSELYFYQPEWVPLTYFKSVREQHIRDGYRTNKVIEEKSARHMKDRKGNYEFLTARMYDRIFFTNSQVKLSNQWSDRIDQDEKPHSRLDKYVHDLKLLLFAPGSEINIPMMGDKTSIFSKSQMKYYNFNITLDTVNYAEPVYIFNITAAPDFSGKQTVIKELTTVFDKQSYQVLHRSYRIAFTTILYSFDVDMDIDLTRHDGEYIPELIRYKGWWNVPFKQPERCSFTFQILDFL